MKTIPEGGAVYVPAPLQTRGKSAQEHDINVEKRYRQLLRLYQADASKVEWENIPTAPVSALKDAYSSFSKYMVDLYAVYTTSTLLIVYRNFAVLLFQPPCRICLPSRPS